MNTLLDYLTVFRSRVGVANVVLPLVGLTAARTETILRKLREVLDQRVEVDVAEPTAARLLDYLVEKQLIGPRPRRSGRYSRYVLVKSEGHWLARSVQGEPLARLPVFQTDLWFSDLRLRSTVGLPTPDNNEEVYDFCLNLGILSKAKGSRTAAGQTAMALRGTSASEENPFVLGLETAALLRQVVERDGLILCELVRELAGSQAEFRRDDLLPDRFIGVARRAYESARQHQLRPEVTTQARAFLRLLEETAAKKARTRRTATANQGRPSSEGPGVLEHRLAPRLEWLTDFGILTKDGLQRNGFSYRQTSLVAEFLARLDEYVQGTMTSEDVALATSVRDPRWTTQRQGLLVSSVEEALLAGYRKIQMSVGPAPIREVCFLAAVQLDPVQQVIQLQAHLLQWAEREPGIRLSGGRYSREPEMVHFSDKVLQ